MALLLHRASKWQPDDSRTMLSWSLSKFQRASRIPGEAHPRGLTMPPDLAHIQNTMPDANKAAAKPSHRLIRNSAGYILQRLAIAAPSIVPKAFATISLTEGSRYSSASCLSSENTDMAAHAAIAWNRPISPGTRTIGRYPATFTQKCGDVSM